MVLYRFGKSFGPKSVLLCYFWAYFQSLLVLPGHNLPFSLCRAVVVPWGIAWALVEIFYLSLPWALPRPSEGLYRPQDCTQVDPLLVITASAFQLPSLPRLLSPMASGSFVASELWVGQIQKCNLRWPPEQICAKSGLWNLALWLQKVASLSLTRPLWKTEMKILPASETYAMDSGG